MGSQKAQAKMAARDMEQRRWERLVTWLHERGMHTDALKVERRPRQDGGYGLFMRDACAPTETLFTVPASAMLNTKTLQPLYPPWAKKLSGTQLVSLHLCRHRPPPDSESADPAFGPYISSLPRHFGFHPLLWLVEGDSPAKILLSHLPPALNKMLKEIEMRFSSDWATCQEYLKDPHCTESDYLWAWLNVNTRCMHYRVKPSRSHPDNLAMCPIMDFANHTPDGEHMEPKPTKEFPARADVSFVATNERASPGEELFFCYGPHANRTLFVEYGFAIPEAFGEVDVEDLLQEEFRRRGVLGKLMQDVLESEGYWGEWTLHLQPEPFVSFRLLTALRLLHSASLQYLDPPTISPMSILEWKETLLGTREHLSGEVERYCKNTLHDICRRVIKRSDDALNVLDKSELPCPPLFAETVKLLWEEERAVAEGILGSDI